VAPIAGRDARRMRAIVQILDMPFVVQIWDFLHNSIVDADMIWLIQHARHVFCLSQEILGAVKMLQPEATVFPFQRSPSRHFAQAPRDPAQPGEIAILGAMEPYVDGIRCLMRAVEILREAGTSYRILHIGAPKMLRRPGIKAGDLITSTGFLESEDERDRALAACTAGFLPGPTREPETDALSRFSIPSRILDFMATGLPIIGTVNPRSATARFCADNGLDDVLFSGPEALARRLEQLAREEAWSASSNRSAAAYSRLASHFDIEQLKELLS
jgi:glycosyltransferase involved in cell wall biosynthesis